MSKIAQMMQAAAGAAGGAQALAIEDVFSTYLYTGNGSTQTITNGIDLAGEGGMLWIKARDNASNHTIFDTERAITQILSSNSTTVTTNSTGWGLTSFNSDGFSLNATSMLAVNNSGDNYCSWSFRKAPRFFDCVTWTGDGTSPRSIAHSLTVTPGLIIVKRIDSSSNWPTWHKDIASGNYLKLNTSEASLSDSTSAPPISSVSDTTFDVRADTSGANQHTNTNGATYVAYLFAHDPLGPSGDGSDGLIACGSFTETASGFEVDLGWEPQFLIYKRTDGTAGWGMVDTMRGFTADRNIQYLTPNGSNAEQSLTKVGVTSTGFYSSSPIEVSGANFIYIAIRRGPMRQPTSGTEVADILGRTGTSTEVTVSGLEFTPDFVGFFPRNGGTRSFAFYDRLRGKEKYLLTTSAAAEVTRINAGVTGFDVNNGYTIGPDTGVSGSSSISNVSGNTYSNLALARAPGFFDVVAYTGGGTFTTPRAHNLTVSPELVIVKARTSTGQMNWYVGHYGLNVYATSLTTAAVNNTNLSTYAPVTESTFVPLLDASGISYIAYLFATLPGVSKVGSYTGNGSSQTIDCGFTSGARFILIKRTDSTGDWYVWDTERGIVTGNDPHLSLNTTAAEVTTDDSIDPDSSGFIVNQVAATNINVNAATYVFYAIA